MDNEIWKDIAGYEGLYQVSNFGRVKSLNYNGSRKDKIMVPYNVHGYRRIRISREKQAVSVGVHRLVAQAFILNPENKPQVNHIDGDKSNNNVSNLEWVNSSENTRHAYRVLGHRASGGRPKKRIKNLDTGEIFSSVKEAATLTGTNRTSIISCCKGIYKFAGRCRWAYL